MCLCPAEGVTVCLCPAEGVTVCLCPAEGVTVCPCPAEGVRLRAESLLRQTGGRRDRGDETDADGDHLWCDKARPRSRSGCGPTGILANASKCGYRAQEQATTVTGFVCKCKTFQQKAATVNQRWKTDRFLVPFRPGAVFSVASYPRPGLSP